MTVPKWCKTIVALLLLPLCFGATRALWMVLRASGNADTVWVALSAGVSCWIVIYLSLPKPMWIYVFGHELTHALWTWLFGGRVKKFRATAQGGHVVVSKSNFLITLAPYFFPLYAFFLIVVFVMGHLIWGWTRYLVWFHFGIGVTYAFHVTLTWHILKTQQSDLTQHGYLFSFVVIWLGNVGVLLIGVPLLATQVDILTALGWFLEATGEVLHRVGQLL